MVTQALSRLLYEERSVAFDSENDEQLWRLFMRRAGMHRVDFLEVVKRGTFRRVAKGDVIYDVTRNDITLHLMVEVNAPMLWCVPLYVDLCTTHF